MWLRRCNVGMLFEIMMSHCVCFYAKFVWKFKIKYVFNPSWDKIVYTVDLLQEQALLLNLQDFSIRFDFIFLNIFLTLPTWTQAPLNPTKFSFFFSALFLFHVLNILPISCSQHSYYFMFLTFFLSHVLSTLIISCS